ncbi:PP2C family protein-serine/threonine phosphatase [bacterium]|nr:PP2C family protein-serine/threonine phosphatase [bacterium]
MKRFAVRDYMLFSAAVLSIAVFTWIFPRLYPESKVNLRFDRAQILEKAEGMIKYLGYDLPKKRITVFMDQDDDQYRYLQNIYGIEKANSMAASDSLNMFWWVLDWDSFKNRTSRQSSHDNSIQVSARNPDSTGTYQVTLHLDLQGRPVSFTAKGAAGFWTGKEKKDSGESYEYAEKIANKILADDFPQWKFDGRESFERRDSIFSKFKWIRQKNIAGEKVVFTLTISNGRVTGFNKHYSYPPGYSSKQSSILKINVIYALLGIIALILIIKRLRSDFIDLKVGLVPAVIVVLLWAIDFFTTLYVQSGSVFSIVSIIGYLITSLFIGGAMWVFFSLGESLYREVWPEKLVVMDTIRRRIFSSDVSKSIVQGVSAGFIISGFIALSEYLLVTGKFAVISFIPHISLFYSHNIPWLYGLHGVLNLLFFVTVVCFAGLPLIKKYFKWPVIGYIIIAFFSATLTFPYSQMSPEWIKFLMTAIVVLFFIRVMLKYEVISLIVAGFTLSVIFYGYAGVVSSNPHIQTQGIILLSIIAGLLIIALITKNKTAGPLELKEFVPDYLQRIYERERQHRELEIARGVQLSFLPQSCPSNKNADIASFCIPAMETGGDYYDFISLAPDKLGVAIGDVSGKGISASFYMTLTKGFLLSQARFDMSPKDVLININELFYKNVKRGVFISMIYSIFDFTNSTLILARAGHNPMIFFRSEDGSTKGLKTPGIALGFEKGDVFSKTIENVVIPMNRGDIFFFYTDGLNEAVNLSGEEFGDERIKRIIRSSEKKSAKELLDKIRAEIDLFSKSMEQHDDMTAVAVKIQGGST